MNGPSVWDYVLSRLMPWKYARIELPEGELEPTAPLEEESALEEAALMDDGRAPALATEAPSRLGQRVWPWLLAVGLACFGQYLLAPRDGSARAWLPGTLVVLAAAALLMVFVRRGQWDEDHLLPNYVAPLREKNTLDLGSLGIGVVLMLVDYVMFIGSSLSEIGQPHFTLVNMAVGLAAVGFMVKAFWVRPAGGSGASSTWERWRQAGPLPIIAGLAAIGLVLFFRLYRLADVPPEMNSDHAEKILDILRVLRGQYLVFFATNGGREALIFYLGAALHKLTGLPLGFLALKIVSATIGLAAQPFIYLLGKEFGGRRVGWLAFVLSGIAYWPNVVSRFGLRLPFYILFSAATLYFIVHGIRLKQRRSFIWAGISLGLGVYGYTPDRLLPLIVLAAFGLALLPLLRKRKEPRSEEQIVFYLTGLLAMIMLSLVLFMPLLSYIMVAPDQFLFRTVTRMGGAEVPLAGSPLAILVKNVLRALAMFSWSGGVIWPISIPDYPALGAVAGGLFYLGVALWLLRIWRHRQPLDVLLLLSIPLLQLPSALALAFPDENPNLYRAGGALVPVFILAAYALHQTMRAVQLRLKGQVGAAAGWALALALIGGQAAQDYQWVFDRYQLQYLLAAQNSSEMAQVAKDFINAGGSPDDVFVMGYPYWVDTRLVAMEAGYPDRDFQLFVDGLPATQQSPAPKLFMLNPQDEAAKNALQQTYPQGWFETVHAAVPGKDFLVFFTFPK